MGAGHNLLYYDAKLVDTVVGIDPCVTSWSLARNRASQLGVPLEFVQGSAEDMPLPSESFDTVLMTYSLCTIPDGRRALEEIRRVLKLEGRLVFCEHAEAPDESVARWQARI